MKKIFMAFINGIADIFHQPEISLKKNSNFEKDDYKALRSDWEKVGNDIRNAMDEYRDLKNKIVIITLFIALAVFIYKNYKKGKIIKKMEKNREEIENINQKEEKK